MKPVINVCKMCPRKGKYEKRTWQCLSESQAADKEQEDEEFQG